VLSCAVVAIDGFLTRTPQMLTGVNRVEITNDLKNILIFFVNAQKATYDNKSFCQTVIRKIMD
jgi:hypothetical protein